MPKRTRDIRVNRNKPSGGRRRGRRPSPKRAAKPDAPKVPADTGSDNIVRQALRLKGAFELEYRSRELLLTEKRSNYAPHGEYGGTIAWVELVERLQKQGVEDPVQYVRELLDNLAILPQTALPKDKSRKPSLEYLLFVVVEGRTRNSFVPLTPAFLAEPETIRLHQEAVRRQRARIINRACSDAAAAKTQYHIQRLPDESPMETLSGLLLDDEISLTPLFRYILAYGSIEEPPQSPEAEEYNPQFRRVCELYRASAYRQYLRDPQTFQDLYQDLLPQTFARDAESFYEGLITADRRRGNRRGER